MGTPARIPSKTVTISTVAELGEEAMALLRPELHPLDFVALLMEKTLYPDAVRFIAHALPKREAVWWGWVCARRAAGENPPPKIKAGRSFWPRRAPRSISGAGTRWWHHKCIWRGSPRPQEKQCR